MGEASLLFVEANEQEQSAVEAEIDCTLVDTWTTHSVFRYEGFRDKNCSHHSSLANRTAPRTILDPHIRIQKETSHGRDLARILFCFRPSSLGLVERIGRYIEGARHNPQKFPQYTLLYSNPIEPYTILLWIDGWMDRYI